MGGTPLCEVMIHNKPWQSAEGKYNLIIADPPYGMLTAAEWDTAPDMSEVWEDFQTLLAPNGVVVVTAAQPFTSEVVLANKDWFRYSLVWEKTKAVGHLNSKKRPMSAHEDILIFSNEKLGNHTYNPQMELGEPYKTKGRPKSSQRKSAYAGCGGHRNPNDGFRHPRSVITFKGVERGWHPTAKPLELMEWLVKTYSNEGDRVLEPYGGSCPVHAACLNTNRLCDSYELNADYYEQAIKATHMKKLF